MLKGLLIILSFSISLFNQAQAQIVGSNNNPLMRACRAQGGQFWIYNLGAPLELPVCQFGHAEIGALDFLMVSAGDSTLSAANFLSVESPIVSSEICQQFDASSILAQDSEGVSREFCQFQDQSTINADTLAKGISHPDNADLVRALSARIR